MATWPHNEDNRTEGPQNATEFAEERARNWDSNKVEADLRSAAVDRATHSQTYRQHLREVAIPAAYRFYLLCLARPDVATAFIAEATVKLRVTKKTPLATLIAIAFLTTRRRRATVLGRAFEEAVFLRLSPKRLSQQLVDRALSISGLARAFTARTTERPVVRQADPTINWVWSASAYQKLKRYQGRDGVLALLVVVRGGATTVANITSKPQKAERHLLTLQQ